jgi:flagellar hook-length control protein FliK
MKDAIAATPQSSPVVDPARPNAARPADEETPFGELLGASLEALAATLPGEITEAVSGNARTVSPDDASEALTGSQALENELADPAAIIAQMLAPRLADPPPVQSAPTITSDTKPAPDIQELSLSRQPPGTGPDVATFAAFQTAAVAEMPIGRGGATDTRVRERRAAAVSSPETTPKAFAGAMAETKLAKETSPRSDLVPPPAPPSAALASQAVAISSLTTLEPEHRHSSAEALSASAPGQPAHPTPALQHVPDLPALQRLEMIPQPIGTRDWDDALANRVSWMATHDIQSAEIRLNPPDLGPVNITLSLSGDTDSVAKVQFSAAHPATREAIESALPRLREMLESSGISLGETGVSAGGEGRQQTSHSHDQTAQRRVHGETLISIAPPARLERGNGMVDTFA